MYVSVYVIFHKFKKLEGNHGTSATTVSSHVGSAQEQETEADMQWVREEEDRQGYGSTVDGNGKPLL